MTTTQTKQRTITLTDRPPVTIREDQWPIIARASHRPGSMRHGTPVPDSETDEYSIRVRAHVDGRAIVYGVVDAATVWTGTQNWRGGALIEAYQHAGITRPDMAAIVAAIRHIGSQAQGWMPDSVVRECIADLPAETL